MCESPWGGRQRRLQAWAWLAHAFIMHEHCLSHDCCSLVCLFVCLVCLCVCVCAQVCHRVVLSFIVSWGCLCAPSFRYRLLPMPCLLSLLMSRVKLGHRCVGCRCLVCCTCHATGSLPIVWQSPCMLCKWCCNIGGKGVASSKLVACVVKQ